jgi:hypothetical protein
VGGVVGVPPGPDVVALVTGRSTSSSGKFSSRAVTPSATCENLDE